MIILDRIPVFTAVAEELSFSRAAERLGRTQSAVSQSVALLEEELETKLFFRDGHSIRLTEPGKLLYDQSLFSLAHIEKALSGIREWKGLERGSLRIGSSLTSAGYLLPPILKDFHDRFPQIDLTVIRVLSEEAPDALKRGEIDVAIGILPQREIPELLMISLSERRDVIISTEELTAHEKDPWFEKLLGGRSLILAGQGMHSRFRIDQMCRNWSGKPKIVLECDDVEVIKKMVISGLGITILPEIAVKEEMNRGLLYGLPVDFGNPVNTIGLITRTDSLSLPALEVFIERIKTLLSAS